MRKLSVWARHHPWPARICILLLYVPLNITGLITGDLLFGLGVQLPAGFLVFAMAQFVITVFFFPNRSAANNTSKEAFYLRHKICNLLLITATFLMICFTGNQTNLPTPFYPLATRTAGYIPASHQAYSKNVALPVMHNGVSKKLNKKLARKQLLHFVRTFRKLYKDKSQGEKIALIALIVIVGFSLMLLLVGLSCSIACGGAEALAYVVFFVGTFGIVFLAVRLIRSLYRGRPRSSPPAAPPVSSR